MDYDRIFEQNIDMKFFYTDYPGKKIVDGRISLENAIARLSKDEYYTLVTYCEGDVLPEQYLPISTLTSDDGTLFATLNPDTFFYDICRNGGIQRISRMNDLSSGSPNYLLGPGPDTISLEEMVMEQYGKYKESKESSVKIGK